METIGFNNRHNPYIFNQQIQVNSQKTAVALMFIRQIEQGILDFRDETSCNIVSDYMRLTGEIIYNANVCVYASLLGFLDNGRRWNKKLNLYSIKELNSIKN
jgi:hypothetical protein